MEKVKKKIGRPIKYLSKEERLLAQRRQQAAHRDRIQKKLKRLEKLERMMAGE